MKNQIKPDPLYNRAMAFAKNYMKSHDCIGFSNVYVLQTVNQAGKVTDEKYGMNLMTDYGMQKFFIDSVSFPNNVYIGNGVGNITVNDNTMLSPITTTAATVSDATRMYDYPLYYAVETGLITATARALVVYFDYDISGITVPVNISEYGIGESTTALWTHSWVYTNLGAPATIQKNPGERLYMTIYFCMSYNKSLIESEWTNGKHIVITTMERFFNRMHETGIYTYKRNNIKASTASSITQSIFNPDNHTLQKITNVTPYNINVGDGNTNGYTDGLTSYTTGFLMTERELLSTAEAVDLVVYPYMSDLTSDNSLSKNFGNVTSCPFTQVDITASYTFNHLTGLYNSSESYSNTASKWYTETLMSTAYAMPICYTSGNTISKMYVYQNIKNDDPIVAIGGAVSSVYATDEYWDVSKWTLISNLSAVPASEQHRKYWITNTNEANLDPIRGDSVYIPGSDRYQYLGMVTSFPNGVQNVCVNTNEEFIVLSGYIYDISLGQRFSIQNAPINSYGWSTIDQIKSYVMDNADGYACVWSIMNNSGSTVYQNYRNGTTWSQTSDSTSNIANRWTAYTTYSETSNGYHILCQTDGSYLDARWGATQSLMLSNILIGCAVSLSTQIAYIESASDHIVKVADVTNISGTPASFAIPSSAGTPTFMFGYDHWIYVSDGSANTYVIDTTAGTVSECNTYIPFATNLHRIRTSSTADCMVVYDYYSGNLSNVYLVCANASTQIKNLGAIPITGTTPLACHLIKYNATNMLLVNIAYSYSSTGCQTYVIDLSHWMFDGTIQSTQLQLASYGTMYIPYGKRLMYQNTLFSILNCIPHRIVGTTNTIGALHAIKHVSSKEWQVMFTNVTGWSGKPPGIQQ